MNITFYKTKREITDKLALDEYKKYKIIQEKIIFKTLMS